ncbi:uncharacterized protein LOC130069323 [Rhinichthys klamathensis goyatoka]|uniref:uncharacterized protein LOC130069323 n=1 Tax=Rhinichthys klamathensis goyatoka TaxID=3034132 RepID=UPI0024B49144|nr:uncharacterized protein LOC130069323 [Rhinichthys klamathensis goyatoka]
MDTPLCYPSFKPDMESIMSVMHDLKEKNLSDNTLFSNLDFAERFLRDHPLKKNSKLLVKGNYSCVQIGQSKETIFIVTSENNQACVDVYIHNLFWKKVTKHCINARHFFNHSCQDEFNSCFTQAQEAVNEGLSRLHIKCNRFSITYTSESGSPGTTVETKCHLKLESLTAEGFLNKKVWLQKEKPTCPGLIACLDYLIKQYLTTNNSLTHCYRFVIHADKEIIKITSGEYFTSEYVLLHDNNEGVSMFPPILQ